MNDTLILLGWSVLSFWNAWFLGRRYVSPVSHSTTHHAPGHHSLTNSLLARSVQFRACAAGPITTERPVIAGLLLRFFILFVLDMFIYMRFAWTPPNSEGMREEWSEHSMGL